MLSRSPRPRQTVSRFAWRLRQTLRSGTACGSSTWRYGSCLSLSVVLAELFLAQFYDTVLPQAQHERTFKRYTTRPEMKSFVAVDAHGRLIGLASIICHASGWTEQPVAYLQDLFVSPKERKRGVGKALLHHAAARVREAGGCKLHWLTKETNYRARAVYDTFADGNAPNGFIQYSKKLA